MKKRKSELIAELPSEPLPEAAESLPAAPPAPVPLIVNHPWTADGLKARGLRCPKCHCIQFADGQNVRNTLRVDGAIRRYRVCRNCGRTWTTIEK